MYTTSDWIDHMVYPIRDCVVFKFTNLGEKDIESSSEWLVDAGPILKSCMPHTV